MKRSVHVSVAYVKHFMYFLFFFILILTSEFFSLSGVATTTTCAGARSWFVIRTARVWAAHTRWRTSGSVTTTEVCRATMPRTRVTTTRACATWPPPSAFRKQTSRSTTTISTPNKTAVSTFRAHSEHFMQQDSIWAHFVCVFQVQHFKCRHLPRLNQIWKISSVLLILWRHPISWLCLLQLSAYSCPSSHEAPPILHPMLWRWDGAEKSRSASTQLLRKIIVLLLNQW